VPANPDGWLLTAARNRQRNAARHGGVRDRMTEEVTRRLEEMGEGQQDAPDLPDERLGLLFVCAHPAIDPAVRTPLMLQAVLGLDATRIAAAFLVPPATMAQRLVRAKARVRDAGLRFALPGPEAWPERLTEVLDAVYAAFGAGWDDPEEISASDGLAAEAIYLGRLLVQLMPHEPEALGLLSLMLHCEARRPARRDDGGRFVPLDRQSPRLWSRSLIIEAEGLLVAAARLGRFGRYQCEAAIQSVHAQRPVTGRVNHAALLTLYDLLAQHAPSLTAFVGQAAVLAGKRAPQMRQWRRSTRCRPSEWRHINPSGSPAPKCWRLSDAARTPHQPGRRPSPSRGTLLCEPIWMVVRR
jgi:RNA polymerase sigma-70 factor (ECF subfamily)